MSVEGIESMDNGVNGVSGAKGIDGVNGVHGVNGVSICHAQLGGTEQEVYLSESRRMCIRKAPGAEYRRHDLFFQPRRPLSPQISMLVQMTAASDLFGVAAFGFNIEIWGKGAVLIGWKNISCLQLIRPPTQYKNMVLVASCATADVGQS